MSSASTTAAAAAVVSSQPQTLTLPAATAATLSPRPFLLSHLQRNPPVRPNGRSPSAFRRPACTTSSLSHCFGSAVVRTGDTAVTCGVQAEILDAKSIADPPRRSQLEQQQEQDVQAGQNHDRDDVDSDLDDQDLRHLNLLVPNIDLATGCSPKHLPITGPPTQEAQTLNQRLYRLLLSSRVVRLADLRIPVPQTADQLEADTETQQQPAGYWTLYISLSVLSLAGTTSLFDTLWAALLAALTDLRLPHAAWDADREMIVCSDRLEESRSLNLRGRPAVVSWGVFEGRQEDGYMREKDSSQQQSDSARQSARGVLDEGKDLGEGRRAWFLADPDTFEEALCRETVSVVVDCSESDKTQLLRVEKSGGSVVGVGELKELLEAAEERWEVWNGVLPRANS